MQTKTIAIVGSGNMGTSLTGGMIAAGYAKENIIMCDPDEAKLQELKEQLDVMISTNNQEAAAKADVIIMAVKPQLFKVVAKDLKGIVQERKPLIISIAAGITIEKMQDFFGKDLSIIRAMPNTAAFVGCSATALFANDHVTNEEKDFAKNIMETFGVAVFVPQEKDMDIVTALSGSGPAYFFLLMEALEEAAVSLGLDQHTARLLTLQTALGAACLAVESETPPAALRQRVTSKGGTTEKALEVLEAHDLRQVFRKALQAAKIRSEALAETKDNK